MLKIICIILISILLSCASSYHSKDDGGRGITGPVTWQYWKENSGWNLYDYFIYVPDENDLNLFKNLLNDKDFHFVIFATTDCDECKENIPKAFKIFDKAGIEHNKITLVGLDGNIDETMNQWQKYNIPGTPVIYIEIDGKTIGEAEYPYMWLENFIEILGKYEKNYKNNN
jgi:hypothetical protein